MGFCLLPTLCHIPYRIINVREWGTLKYFSFKFIYFIG